MIMVKLMRRQVVFALGLLSMIGYKMLMTHHVNVDTKLVDMPAIVNVLPLKSSNPSTNDTQPSKLPLAVWFTTIGEGTSNCKPDIYHTTVKNWAVFYPLIQPVLFLTDSHVANASHYPYIQAARDLHWQIFPVTHVNEFGTPFIKDMYMTMQEKFDAEFYVFSNGDIIYDGIVETLQAALTHKNDFGNMLIVGQRWDHNISKEQQCPGIQGESNKWQPKQVQLLASAEYSSLHSTAGKDFFITTKSFPWHRFVNVVIGRKFYDSYILSRAIELGITTVDATTTVSAVHQVGPGGVQTRKWTYPDTSYNRRGIPGMGDYRFSRGSIGNTGWVTEWVGGSRESGRVTIVKRNG